MHETTTGALNLFASTPRAFDDDAVRTAEILSTYAAVALGNAQAYEASTVLSEQMQAAMQSRAVIEQAKGVIVAEQGCTPEEAFTILTKQSQNTNRKLRDVAATLLTRVQHRETR